MFAQASARMESSLEQRQTERKLHSDGFGSCELVFFARYGSQQRRFRRGRV